MTTFNTADLHQMEIDQSIPQWKRELLVRRRALGRTLHVGNSSVKLTCPAVVALVRQPEGLDGIDNVEELPSSTGQESTLCLLNQSCSQLPAEFHPSLESFSVDIPVSNMRLLDSCSDVTSPLINGIDVQNKQSEVVSEDLCANYNLIMGQDKIVTHKKKSATSRSKFDCSNCSVNRQQNVMNNVIDQVASNNGTNGISGKGEDYLSDSSEELQYGPGIVSKLKTKYLSMTLRGQKRNSRPSINNLRRATSLENMLDADGNLNKDMPITPVKDIYVKTDTKNMNNQPICVGKTLVLNSHCRMKYLKNRSLDTMKRARSMDALLKSEIQHTSKTLGPFSKSNNLNNKPTTIHGKPIASIVNENVVIVENVRLGISDNNVGPKIGLESGVSSKQSLFQFKRSSSVTADGELPPPDLVKQTLKIFETSPKRRTIPQVQSNLSKLVSEFNNSTSSSNSQIPSTSNRSSDKRKLSSNKPTLSPKPVMSPEKFKPSRSRILSPKAFQGSTNNCVSSFSPVSTNQPFSIVTNTLDKPIIKHEIIESMTNNQLSNYNVSNGPNVGLASLQKNNPVAPVNSCEKVSVPSITGSHICSDKNDSYHSEVKANSTIQSDDFEEVDSNDCSKPVPESALENIRRGGMSVQFCFKNDNSQNSLAAKSHLPRSSPQALNTSLVNQKLEKSPPIANVAPIRTSILPHIGTKQVGIIRPLVSTKPQPLIAPVLTEKEIEKNLINRVKSIEQPISKVVVSIKSLPDNVVLGSVASDLVANKNLSLPHVCANSKAKTQGLWDEKLWHQAQNTVVFNFSDRKEVPDYIENDGLILKGKRDHPMPGESGVVLLGEVAEESCTDAEDLPPSPCDVTFEGDNVLINGKSNLKKSPKLVKLRIKFNDEATTMFEYPSESSLVEQEPEQPEAKESCSQSSPSPAPSSNLPLALGEAPPDYLPPNPPVVSKVFKHSVSLPSLAAVEQLVTVKDNSPVLLVKGKAPLPPTDNRPPVPKRSPMRRSLSDHGGVRGSLGAYTPRKTGAGDWQLELGMAPVPPPSVAALPSSPQEDHLKLPEATTAWSEDTASASDLLF